MSFSPLATVELVEAASRIGKEDAATPELERLAQGTSASGTYWAGAVEARCRALLSHGEAAERLYREAIERLTPTELGFDLARPISSSESGCDASAGRGKRASSCAPPTGCSATSAWGGLASVPV